MMRLLVLVIRLRSLCNIRFNGTSRWLQIARFIVDALASTFGVIEKAQLFYFHVVSSCHVVDGVHAFVKVEINQFGSFWFAFLCPKEKERASATSAMLCG